MPAHASQWISIGAILGMSLVTFFTSEVRPYAFYLDRWGAALIGFVLGSALGVVFWLRAPR